MAFITFLTANWPVLLGILSAAVGIFAAIAKLTPTPKDDGVAAWLMNALNVLPEGAKQTFAEKKAEKKGPTPALGE